MGYLVMDPLISVIVPIYNVEKYLRKCIESIINQSYKNLEIILVDDGSTDSCGSICDEYAKIDKRIKVIHKENGGLSDARNMGIEAAGGDYLMFIDGDDYINEKMAEILYQRIKKDNTDLAMCNLFIVDEKGKDIKERNYDMPLKDGIITSDEAVLGLLGNKNGYYVSPCNKLYNRKVFNKIRFPFGKKYEDAFIMHMIFINCQKISCVSKPLYCYVQRIGSAMRSAANIKNFDLVEALYNRCVFLINSGMFKYAVRTLASSVAFFCIIYRQLDKNEKHTKLRIKVLKTQFNQIYKKYFLIIIRNCSLRHLIFLTVFFINKDFCSLLVQNINKRKQRKNG